MPFRDERIYDAGTVGISEYDQPEVSTIDSLSASFRQENIIGSSLSRANINASYGDILTPDPNFNPYRDEEFKEIVGQYPDRFERVYNRAAAGAVRDRIEQENRDRATRDASGWTGVAFDILAGVADPTVLIPGGALVKSGEVGYKIGRTAAVGAAAAGLGTAVQEGALQATQETRSLEESAYNIGGSVLLGGIIGMGAAKYFSNAEWGRVANQLEADLTEQVPSVGDAVSTLVSRARAAGADSVDAASIEDLGIGGPKAAQIAARATAAARISPGVQNLLSPAASVREITAQLIDNPIYLSMNMEGKTVGAGVENAVKYYERGQLASFITDLRSNYKEAKKNGFTGTQVEFHHAVSYAARRLDTSDNLFVQKTSESVRAKLLDALFNRAKEVFPQFRDVKVTTAPSYLTRMWSRPKLIGDETDFRSVVRKWLSEEFERARFQAEETALGNKIVQANELDERYNSAFGRLGNVERRLSDRARVREGRLGRIRGEERRRFDFLSGQAPREVVRALREGAENDSLVSLVKESNQVNRVRLAKTPVLQILKNRGGVRIGSPLAQELNAIGVTPKRVPALFKKEGGRGAADNIVASEFDIFDDIAKDANGYVEQQAIIDAIQSEIAGTPLRNADELALEETASALSENVREWLERVGLTENSSIGEIRAKMREVLGNERSIADTDSRIARLEQELQEFDDATETIQNERLVAESEAKNLADQLHQLEEEISANRDLANSSPRIKRMVDYAEARKDYGRARYDQVRLQNRKSALERLDSEGRLTSDLARELDTIDIDLSRVNERMAKAIERSDKLRSTLPKQREELPDFIDDADKDDYLNGIIDDVFNNLTGRGAGDVPEWMVPVTRGPLKGRTFNIPDELVEKFLENDIELIARYYTRTMAAEVELTQKFGRADMRDQIQRINDEYTQLAAAAETPEARLKLEQRRKDDVRRIEAFRDMVRGTYRASEENSSWSRITRAALTWNYIRLLGGVTLSSLTDAIRPVSLHGVRSAMEVGLPSLVKNTQAIRLNKLEAKEFGTVTDVILQSRLSALAELNDPYAYGNKYERYMGNVSSTFSKLTGLAWFNDTMRMMSSVMTQNRMMKNIVESAGDYSKLDPYERAYMGFVGINENMASRMLEQYNRFGLEEQGIKAANALQWDDEFAKRTWAAALNKDVDRTIIIPGKGDLPLWTKTNTGRLISQFKSFGLAANQRVLIAGLQERPQRLAGQLVFGTVIGMMIAYLKYYERGDAEEAQKLLDNPGKWVADGLDRSGVLSIPFEISNTAEKLGFTGISEGISRLAGDEDSSGSPSRYASRGKLGAVLGPSAGIFEDLTLIADQLSAGDLKKSGVNAIIRQVPGNSLPGIRSAIHVGIKPAAQEAVE